MNLCWFEDTADDIIAERDRQQKKWGGNHSWGRGDCSSHEVSGGVSADPRVGDLLRSAILAEECGEVARAVIDGSPAADLRAELIQVAAVAVAWVEHIDTN